MTDNNAMPTVHLCCPGWSLPKQKGWCVPFAAGAVPHKLLHFERGVDLIDFKLAAQGACRRFARRSLESSKRAACSRGARISKRMRLVNGTSYDVGLSFVSEAAQVGKATANHFGRAANVDGSEMLLGRKLLSTPPLKSGMLPRQTQTHPRTPRRKKKETCSRKSR